MKRYLLLPARTLQPPPSPLTNTKYLLLPLALKQLFDASEEPVSMNTA